MRLTEEEVIALGFYKDANGDWKKRRKSPADKGVEAGSACDDPRKVSEPKRDVQSAPKKTNKTKARVQKSGTKSPKYKIVVTSYRWHHCDPDNLCPKHYIDMLVKAGKLPDDSSRYVESVEKKVILIGRGDIEHTDIEVFESED